MRISIGKKEARRWQRVMIRAGRALLSIVVAGVAQYVSDSPYALVVAPLLSAVGKWMREQGFRYVPV